MSTGGRAHRGRAMQARVAETSTHYAAGRPSTRVTNLEGPSTWLTIAQRDYTRVLRAYSASSSSIALMSSS